MLHLLSMLPMMLVLVLTLHLLPVLPMLMRSFLHLFHLPGLTLHLLSVLPMMLVLVQIQRLLMLPVLLMSMLHLLPVLLFQYSEFRHRRCLLQLLFVLLANLFLDLEKSFYLFELLRLLWHRLLCL
jgi:hypothetical protein